MTRKERKDFYSKLLELGIAETRIPDLIDALNSLHKSLVLMDDENLERLKQIGSLDNLFDLYLQNCKVSKKISLRNLKILRFS